jgi:hypothetical protein
VGWFGVLDVTRLGLVLGAQAVGYVPGAAVLAGLTGGLAFLVIVWDAIAGGVTRLGYLYVLGAGVAPRTSRGTAYGLGLLVHVALSAVLGLAYAGLFDAVAVSSVGDGVAVGLLIGLLHGAAAMVAAGWVLAHVHSLVRNGQLPKPGTALTGYGRSTPVVWMIAHVAFGATVGAVYAAGTL